MKRFIGTLGVTGLAGVGAAFGATASPTSVGIAYDHSSTSFVGKIRSRAAACRSGRRITVVRKGGGRIGSTTSDASGNWRLYPKRSFLVGDYYATTPAVQRNGAWCAAGRSLTTRAS